MDKFEIPLCEDCQKWYKALPTEPSLHAKRLFLRLKEMGLNVNLEKDDGHKRIDISATDYRMHIEVDGEHHNTNPAQAFKDLLRTLYSLRDGFHTLRIPNSMIEEDDFETANIVCKILLLNQRLVKPAQKSHYQRLVEHFWKTIGNAWKISHT